MHAALQRVVTDLSTGRLTHDACPFTKIHMDNARRAARTAERYILTKPSQVEKIDLAMSTTLAHEAASDARAIGWLIETPVAASKTSNVMYGFS